MSQSIKEWYDQNYHYQEDAETPQWSRIAHVLSHFPKHPASTWLDLGGGVGSATQLALRLGFIAPLAAPVVFDLSQSALSLGRHKWPALNFVLGDGQQLPFADATFERLFSFGVIEHFPNVSLGLQEVSRVLAPNGLACLVVPNWWVKTAQGDIQELAQHDTKWIAMFESAGLKVVSRGVDSGPPLFKNLSPLGIGRRALLRIISRLPNMAYQFIFIVQKA